MPYKSDAYIQRLGLFRSSLVELTIAAVVLSIGASVVATGVAMWTPTSSFWTCFVGSAIILAGVFLVFIRGQKNCKESRKLSGILILRKDQNEIVRIDRYPFSEAIASSVRALNVENKAIEKIWNTELFSWGKLDAGKIEVKRNESAKLAAEAIEYFVLQEISTHLIDYFNSEKFSADKTVTLKRKNIPEIVSENRFIDQFSRPIAEREQFLDEIDSLVDLNSTTWMTNKYGSVFSNFEIVLPIGSQIKRLSKGCILITTKRFALGIKNEISYFSMNLPRQFPELYLGYDWSELRTYKCSISFDVKFPFWSLITASGWEYYKWLDSVIETLEENFDFDYFLEKIAWEQGLTCSTIQKRRNP